MIKLTVDPQVLAALQADFPKPANSARRALDKYVQRLEKMLFQAFLFGLTSRQRKFKLYPLALSTLWEQGGQIGPQTRASAQMACRQRCALDPNGGLGHQYQRSDQ